MKVQDVVAQSTEAGDSVCVISAWCMSGSQGPRGVGDSNGAPQRDKSKVSIHARGSVASPRRGPRRSEGRRSRRGSSSCRSRSRSRFFVRALVEVGADSAVGSLSYRLACLLRLLPDAAGSSQPGRVDSSTPSNVHLATMEIRTNAVRRASSSRGVTLRGRGGGGSELGDVAHGASRCRATSSAERFL